jgi:hypothetical protein
MRELNSTEIAQISGGLDSIYGLTQLTRGFALTGVIGSLTTAYSVGYGFGMAFNATWNFATGNDFGISIYNKWND